MSDVRTADQVHAEQVAQAAQAVAEAQQATARQQGQAGQWMAAGHPSDASAVLPGSREHD